MFASAEEVGQGLAAAGYLPDPAVSTVVFLAGVLGKPVLAEGPAGVGKTELAKAVAAATGAQLVRLQCYEGLDEAKALYEWNYRKQLLRIQADAGEGWEAVHDDVFSEEYLLDRPLLTALRDGGRKVLLVDEVDKVDFEFEALLLEILSDFQVTIPELGTVTAVERPFVVLTSNATRELSEALKRRCLFLAMDYPDLERETAIVRTKVPDITEQLAAQLVRVVRSLRDLELRKAPSISETLDWAQTLLALGIDEVDPEALRTTIGVLLKHRSDVERGLTHLAEAPPAR
jgi:MoxR-like ATPase